MTAGWSASNVRRNAPCVLAPSSSSVAPKRSASARSARPRRPMESSGAARAAGTAGEGRLNGRRGRGRHARRLALEALDEVLENGVRRDVELHLEARRVGEILQQHEIARIAGRDPETLAGKRERKRAEATPLFRGKALDDVRVRGDERRARDARETVGLRKSGDQDLLGDGARGEKRPLDRPAVRLLPRRGAAQPAYRQVAGFRQDVSDSERDGHCCPESPCRNRAGARGRPTTGKRLPAAVLRGGR